MATKEFILQGFTTRTHADALRELFNIPNIERILMSVAFVSDDGVQQIENQLQANADNVTVFAGIRNDITSHQALKRLYDVISNNLHIVDTGSRNVIFHPKLYLVRGSDRARMVIGSANLTLGGLNNNIEAGLLLNFDLADASDRAIVDNIQSELLALPVNYRDNVLPVNAVSELDTLLANGRLIDEMASPPPRPATAAAGGGGANDTVPRIRLRVTPLRRALRRARAPRAARPRVAQPRTRTLGATPPPALAPAIIGVELELVWESKALTRRDLNIPEGERSNKTGSVNLDKGLLPDDAAHPRYFQHYFRDSVFSALDWTGTSKPTVDEAFTKFQLVLKGISYGEFDLRIAHTTSTTSRTYVQGNAMTRLSWGPIREYIAQEDFIGRTLALYRDEADPKRFVLEID